MGDQKHTCLPVYTPTGNIQYTSLPQQAQAIQPAGQDIGPGLFPGFKSQLCLLLALWLGR